MEKHPKPSSFNRLQWLLWSLLVIFSLALLVQGIWSYFQPEITIEWSTANELDTAGFNILRSESQDGPFTRINQNLLPSSDDPLSGGDYQYQDKDVRFGKIYYYILEDVGFEGEINRHGPVVQKAENPAAIYLLLSLILIIIAVIFAWIQFRDAQSHPYSGRSIQDD